MRQWLVQNAGSQSSVISCRNAMNKGCTKKAWVREEVETEQLHQSGAGKFPSNPAD